MTGLRPQWSTGAFATILKAGMSRSVGGSRTVSTWLGVKHSAYTSLYY